MIEHVLVEMKRILDAHLSTELGRQDGEFGDGIVLDPVNTVSIGDETPQVTGLPAVMLIPAAAEAELWATGKKDVRHSISVKVVVTDTDENVSNRKLWRMMRAVENVLEIHGPGTGPMIDVKVTGIDYRNLSFGISENSTEKGGALSVSVLERLDSYTATQI